MAAGVSMSITWSCRPGWKTVELDLCSPERRGFNHGRGLNSGFRNLCAVHTWQVARLSQVVSSRKNVRRFKRGFGIICEGSSLNGSSVHRHRHEDLKPLSNGSGSHQQGELHREIKGYNYGRDAGAVIKVIGVGGGGCNAVNEMIRTKLPNVEFWAVNTDLQALDRSLAPHKVQIGREITRGRGAGGSCDIGEESATESLAELSMALEGADLVFIAAGMGGGTGSGAGPVVTRLAKAMGALTIGIVTEPFGFEGQRRANQAQKGLEAMRNAADTVVVVPNDRLLETVPPDTSVWDAFHLVDDVLRQGVQGISDIITVPGLVNVDFADVRAIMSNAGSAMLGIGVGYGKNRAEDVTRSAIMSPLLHCVNKPTGIVYNVTGGTDLTLHEVNIAAEIVYSMADPNANVIFGAVIDEKYEGMLRMTIIATGFGGPAVPSISTMNQLTRRVGNGDINFEQSKKQERLTAVPQFLRRSRKF